MLNTGTDQVAKLSVFGSLNVTVATPTASASGQKLTCSPIVPNAMSEHCAAAVGWPSKPAGILKVRSFCSAGDFGSGFLNVGTGPYVSFRLNVEVSWYGCAPAWVSTSPVSLSGVSSYDSTPKR